MRKSRPGTPRSTAPPPSIDVAPHSLFSTWAVSWHSTAPQGGQSALSDSALAAVPLVTGNTRASGCSNTSRTTDWSRAVTSSSP